MTFEIGQTWEKRSTLPPAYRITIERLARRTVFGPITFSKAPGLPRMDAQVRYSQLRAKWHLVEEPKA